MTDELVERVARAICRAEWHDDDVFWEQHVDAAQAALAWLKPGDVWGDWRITKNADVNEAALGVITAFAGLGDELKKLETLEVASKAAEEMRERIAQIAEAHGSTPGRELAETIRALEVSDD